MTTATIAVAASADDALQSTTTVALTAAAIGLIATDQWLGIRFNNVPIAQGQIVTNAFVDLEIDTSSKNDAEGTWYGEAHDSAPTFTTAASSISSRTSTAATVSWTTNDLGNAGDIVSSPNLATVVQEIVNRPGWVKGNSIVLIYDHNSSSDQLQVAAYDHATRQEPRLRLTYSGIGRVATRANTGGTSAALTSVPFDMATAGSIASGNWLVAKIALNNSGTSGAAVTLTATDTRNGSWTVIGPAHLTAGGGVDDGADAFLAYVKANSTYTNGDDVTLHFTPGCTGYVMVIEEWTNIDSVTPLAGVTPTTATGTSTTPSVSITPTSSGQLVMGVLAHEGSTTDTYTVDSDTTNGNWYTSTSQDGSHSGTTSDICVRSQYKIVTASGAQTWNLTTTSREWAALAVVFGSYSGVSRDMAAKVSTSSEVDSLFKRAFNYTAKGSSSTSAKSPRFNVATPYVSKVATASNFKGNVSIGGSVAFAAKVPTSTSSRLRRTVPAAGSSAQPRAYQTKPSTSNNLKAGVKITKRILAKARASANAKGRLSYKRSLTVVGATNKPKISFKAKGTLDSTTTTGNTPSMPSDILPGTPASKMWGWSGNHLVYTPSTTLSAWKTTYGFTGMSTTMTGAPFIRPVLENMGQRFYYQGTNPANVVDPLGQTTATEYNWHQAHLGYGVPLVNGGAYGTVVSPSLGLSRHKRLVDTNYTFYMGYYLRENSVPVNPYMGDWWNDSIWTAYNRTFSNIGAGLRNLGADGITFDCESAENFDWVNCTSTTRPTSNNLGKIIHETDTGLYYRWTGSWTPTTLNEIHTVIESRGYQCGQGIFGSYPNCSIVVYEWRMAGGAFDSKFGFSQPYPRAKNTQDSFFYGMMRAMQEANGQGVFHNWDALYYKSAHVSPWTHSQRGNQNVMALLSQRLPSAVKNHMMMRFATITAHWAGTDNAGFYFNSPEPEFAAHLENCRRYSMHGVRSEYLLSGNADVSLGPGQTTGSPPQSIYSDTRTNPPGGHRAGMVAATSTTTQDVLNSGSILSISAITQNRTGTTVALTFTCGNSLYGIRNVHWTYYASNGTSILNQGEATMVWNANGGTSATNFNNSFMSCTVSIPNAGAGQYVILNFWTTIGQRISRRIQLA